MASPEKKLGEFLKEQQEPFILEIYLLEKGCSRKLKRSDASSCFFKPLFPFSKVLTILHKKLHFQNRSKSALFGNPETRTEHAPHEVSSFDQTVVETDRFSTASSSTVFNSCSDVDEDGNSFWSCENNPLFSSDNFQVSSLYNMGVQSQQDTNNRKQPQRCIEGSVTHGSLNHDVCVCGKEQHRPGKITEDSLLSAALWSSLIQSAKRSDNYTKQLQGLLGPNVSKVLKSKRVLHETKQLLFDCVREITMSQKGCNKQMVQFMGAENLGKVMWERTKKWCGDESLDDCVNEWSSKLLKAQVMEICVEIADAILEGVNDEVVSEMIEIEILPATM